MEPAGDLLGLIVAVLSVAVPAVFGWLQHQNVQRKAEAKEMAKEQLAVQTRLTQLETWRVADIHRLDGFENRVIASLERMENKIDRLSER